MSQVSKIKLSKENEKRLIDSLETILTKINKNDQMDLFLFSLLTPTEKLMLAKRMAAVILIREGIPMSQIAASLHLTPSTLSKLELVLEARGEGYDIAIRVLKREKMFEDIRNNLVKLVGYSVRAAGGYVKPGII